MNALPITVTELVAELALQYWTPANTPDLTGVVAAVTGQLPRLGSVINGTVIAFAQRQVAAVFAAEEATEEAHGGPPASGGTASTLTATATLATGSVSGAISTLATCAAIYHRNATQSIPRNVQTVVNFDILEVDTDSAVTTGAAWHFTVPAGKGGLYHIAFRVVLTVNATTTLIFANIQLNGGEIRRVFSDPVVSSSNSNPVVGGSSVCALVPGDTISCAVSPSDSTSNLVTSGNPNLMWVSIVRIPGS
jgi:hypothetical protein